MTHTIRTASLSDREPILSLAPRLTEGVASWRDPTAVRNAVAAWVADSVDRLSEDGRIVLIAEEGSSVIGFITVESKHHWTGDLDAYIGELVVSSDAEGRGVGSALIRAAIEWSRNQGLDRVSVSTGADNVRARAIYQTLGFNEEDITLSTTT